MSNLIKITKKNLPLAEQAKVKGFLTLKNKKWEEIQRFSRYGRYTKEPEYLKFYGETPDSLFLPRNYFLHEPFSLCLPELKKAKGKKIEIKTSIVLRDYQQEVTDQLVYSDNLILLKTGGGKTVIAIWVICKYAVSTLVVCRTNQLLDQWKKRIQDFTDATVGKYDKKKNAFYDITLATYSQLAGTKKGGYKKAYTEDFYNNFGHIIFDEYHNAGAETYQKICERATCHYRTSLTATFRRKDGMENILKYHAGNIIKSEKESKPVYIYLFQTGIKVNEADIKEFSVKAVGYNELRLYEECCIREEGEEKPFTIINKIKEGRKTIALITETKEEIKNKRVYPKKRITTVRMDTEVIKKLSLYRDLNNLCAEFVKAERRILIISRRVDFILILAWILKGFKVGIILSDKEKQYREYAKKEGYEKIKDYEKWVIEEAQIIIAIEQLSKEGMDIERLDTLIIVNVIKDIEQAVGRINRDYPNAKYKLCILMQYDILMFQRMFSGKKGTKYWINTLGYKMINDYTKYL